MIFFNMVYTLHELSDDTLSPFLILWFIWTWYTLHELSDDTLSPFLILSFFWSWYTLHELSDDTLSLFLILSFFWTWYTLCLNREMTRWVHFWFYDLFEHGILFSWLERWYALSPFLILSFFWSWYTLFLIREMIRSESIFNFILYLNMVYSFPD